jgi:hypothetical protein
VWLYFAFYCAEMKRLSFLFAEFGDLESGDVRGALNYLFGSENGSQNRLFRKSSYGTGIRAGCNLGCGSCGLQSS